MKKYLVAAAVAAVFLICLCACGNFVSIMPGSELDETIASSVQGANAQPEDTFTRQPLFSFLGWEDFGENYYDQTPVALSYQTEAGEGGIRGCEAYVFDRASIIAACDAFRGMIVTGEAAEPAVSGAEYTFIMEDGREYAASFGTSADGLFRILSDYTGDYTVTGGDELWNIAFPSYSQEFDVFDLYFSDSIRAFADGFQENTPVSVGYRMNSGATITSEDPAVVQSAFQALAGATVTIVENQPDQNIDLTQLRDFVFTMGDGTSYSFTFAQQCLAVTANQTFGPVYYWLSGIEALWNIDFSSDNKNGTFEGGAITGLREDMQATAQIVNGERDDLTVMGVFVDYAIGENKGYLALDGEKATSFLQTLSAIQATSETVKAPEGDKITVSVTLSDSTGPIFYFTGDTIQQVVGINYVCDSGAMEALRSTVLELASDEENAAEIEGESGTE